MRNTTVLQRRHGAWRRLTGTMRSPRRRRLVSPLVLRLGDKEWNERATQAEANGGRFGQRAKHNDKDKKKKKEEEEEEEEEEHGTEEHNEKKKGRERKHGKNVVVIVVVAVVVVVVVAVVVVVVVVCLWNGNYNDNSDDYNDDYYHQGSWHYQSVHDCYNTMTTNNRDQRMTVPWLRRRQCDYEHHHDEGATKKRRTKNEEQQQ